MAQTNAVLPNFGTIGTLSCFDPYKQTVTVLAADEPFLRILERSEDQLHDTIRRLKAEAAARNFRYVLGWCYLHSLACVLV